MSSLSRHIRVELFSLYSHFLPYQPFLHTSHPSVHFCYFLRDVDENLHVVLRALPNWTCIRHDTYKTQKMRLVAKSSSHSYVTLNSPSMASSQNLYWTSSVQSTQDHLSFMMEWIFMTLERRKTQKKLTDLNKEGYQRILMRKKSIWK